jgi:V8-like Glu-specific endopeptidase
LCTGFLVKDNVIATAGHCACEKDVTDLRIVFGYNISDSDIPATQVPNEKVYKGVKIIHRVYDPMGSGADWALVKLDRKVEGQTVAILSEKDISRDQPIYILGHPCGLPLKYSFGAQVCGMNKSYFSADLNVYSGNSGSPVFNYDTHEVVGIVVRGDSQDFRWTGEGWLSIIYPNRDFLSKEPQCTKISEFIEYCK